RDVCRLCSRLPFLLRNFRRLMDENRIEAVNVQCCGVNAICTWLFSFFYPCRYILTLQGFSMQVFPFLKGIKRFVYRILFKCILLRASCITSCSQALLNDALAHIPSATPRTKIIPNGVEADEFENKGKPLVDVPYILCLGRMHAPFKGFDLALMAFRDILDQGYDVHLVIAGEGEALKEYKELAQLLGISNRVIFYGRAERAHAINLFQYCLFFVMPSRIEPFGIVNLEAMAAGKAVIAARTGGIPEIVEDGREGLLFTPCDVESLAQAIKRLLDDKDLRQRLSHNGSEKVKADTFNWGKAAEKYLEAYRLARL
ncbi:MAG: glycosyltransferase family 4 protein, partial [Candidatus Omnitrophota bacterium]